MQYSLQYTYFITYYYSLYFNYNTPYIHLSYTGIYDRGYRRLLTILKDAGCVFTGHTRPSPIDQDICLSMRDKATSKLPTPASSGSTSSSNTGSGSDAEDGGQSSEGRLLTYTGTLSKTMVSIMHLMSFTTQCMHVNKRTIYTQQYIYKPY